jgi:4-diphosphocytidyl-2-C-methyl-D-erythritol kinase
MAIRRSAAAKINLCLHVVGQRADGLHNLQSAVAFLDCGEWVEVRKSGRTQLNILGPKAAELPRQDDNLILKAAALFPRHCQTDIRLHKTMPVASGIGGGSAGRGGDIACDGRALGSSSARCGGAGAIGR